MDITRAVMLNGPNAFISPNSGVRAPEAVFTGAGAQLRFTSSNPANISIQGFTFQTIIGMLSSSGVIEDSSMSGVVSNLTFARSALQLHRLPLRRSMGSAFFSHNPFAQSGRHLLGIARGQIEFGRDLLIRQVQLHQIETQHPHLQRLMMTFKDRLRQIIKLALTGLTFIPLTFSLLRVKPPFRDLRRPTPGPVRAFRPTQLAKHFVILGFIHQMLDVDQHGTTPNWS
ncbi:MAG: hypothetical protein NZM11_00290 [Anaerolineales bacterium]|nr:hypothetical protein [Anaerolineales bacterium]